MLTITMKWLKHCKRPKILQTLQFGYPSTYALLVSAVTFHTQIFAHTHHAHCRRTFLLSCLCFILKDFFALKTRFLRCVQDWYLFPNMSNLHALAILLVTYATLFRRRICKGCSRPHKRWHPAADAKQGGAAWHRSLHNLCGQRADYWSGGINLKQATGVSSIVTQNLCQSIEIGTKNK